MNYNTLGFTLQRKCTAQCEMCCFLSNPNCAEVLSVERIKSYIDESERIDEIKTIAFTGGEPFMEYDKLLDLVSYATSKGKRVTCVTNGFWANNYEITYVKLKKLVDVGLKHLSVSYDNYHARYVKLGNVKNVLSVATALNLPHTVAMVKIKDEKMGGIIDELAESVYSSNIQIVPCLPAGGALKNFSDDLFDRTISSKGLRCIYGGNLVVAYDGRIYPCCSQMISCMDLSVGNFSQMSLTDALNKIKNNSILYLLRNKSMDFFVDILKEHKIQIKDYVVNPCELCADIFSSTKNLNILYPYIQKEIRRLKNNENQIKSIPSFEASPLQQLYRNTCCRKSHNRATAR